uniref:vacuolar protein-sorting-associated protein 25-like n=2 Tax=Myxine glutinosa TaxID=7769 RepID=UPI00358DEB33
MGFSWPWQYSFQPFFTLQPNMETRQKQLAAWCSLVLEYCRHHRLYALDLQEAQESVLFNNRQIQRKLPSEVVIIVLEELRKKGNVEWQDKGKNRCLVLWRRPEEWGNLLYQWVIKVGLTNTVCTLYELVNGEDTVKEEFHGLEEWLMLRALQCLQDEGKAEVFGVGEGQGVKFF